MNSHSHPAAVQSGGALVVAGNGSHVLIHESQAELNHAQVIDDLRLNSPVARCASETLIAVAFGVGCYSADGRCGAA